MTGAEAGRVVSMLNAYFPRDALEPESMAVWVQEVARLTSYDDAVAAARTIGRTGDRLPHVSEVPVDVPGEAGAVAATRA